MFSMWTQKHYSWVQSWCNIDFFFLIFSHCVFKVDKSNYIPPVSISNHICLGHWFSPKHFLDFKAYPLLRVLFKTSKISWRQNLHPLKVLLKSLIKKICLRQMFVDQHKLFKYFTWFLSVNPVMGVEEQTVKTFKVLACLFSSLLFYTVLKRLQK